MMLAVQVDLLTGRYVATQFNDRNRAEWPPHPARLFSAAVAAWADADEPDERERAALRWWEEQGDPSVRCSWGDDGYSERAAVTHYVPVNDTQVVGRDLSATYLRLRASINAVDAVKVGNPKALAKAEQAATRMQRKATDDSRRASSAGRAPASALGLLPDARLRHARVYPTAIPIDDSVVYQWPDADANSPHVSVLDSLLVRVPRLGHSSSFVAVSIVDADDPATLVPNSRGRIGLRVASPGQLDALEEAFASHEGTEPRILPALVTGYREFTAHVEPRTPVFGQDWRLLELAGRARFTIRDTLAIARAVRGALLHHADRDPVPEIISGHVSGADTPTPATTRPHLAVVPLPFVGHAHADGRVRAVALVLPTDLAAGDEDQVWRSVRRWLADSGGQLNLGSRGSLETALIEAVDAPTSARPTRWCGSSRRWLSVTPIALDRNPGNLRHSEVHRHKAAERAAEEIVAGACVNIGLPPPLRVSIQTDPLMKGSASIRSFPKYAVQGGRVQRVLVHAAIEFGERVFGPVLLGAGRYYGYGLCAPADRSRVEAASRG